MPWPGRWAVHALAGWPQRVGCAESGTESRISTLILPLNGALIAAARTGAYDSRPPSRRPAGPPMLVGPDEARIIPIGSTGLLCLSRSLRSPVDRSSARPDPADAVASHGHGDCRRLGPERPGLGPIRADDAAGGFGDLVPDDGDVAEGLGDGSSARLWRRPGRAGDGGTACAAWGRRWCSRGAVLPRPDVRPHRRPDRRRRAGRPSSSKRPPSDTGSRIPSKARSPPPTARASGRSATPANEGRARSWCPPGRGSPGTATARSRGRGHA